jgi:hypothetical protein
MLVKKIALGVAAALLLGLGSLSVPASAATPLSVQPAASITDVSAARYMVRKHVRRGPVCTVRKVVRRGPHGRRVVTRTRICR